jgi:hypothetical protein
VNARAYAEKLTPLDLAARKGYTNVVEFLRQHGGRE